MPDSDFLIPLDFMPGVQRDGTRLDADRAVDALWCRWRLSRPRKMGGYVRAFAALAGISRRIHMFYTGDLIIIHVGTAVSLQQIVLDRNGTYVSDADRTPLTFEGGPDVGWTLDAIFDTTSDAVVLLAHAVPDLTSAASSLKTIPFLGQIDQQTRLQAFQDPGAAGPAVYTAPNLAGGIVCVQPYVFGYDVDGRILWSAPNLPNYLGVTGGASGAGEARASAQKIVAGMPLRGGGVNSPAAIFWSLSEVITASFVGTPAFFAFNTVSPSSSILSTDAVIEYDGLYFWAGSDRFLAYNGTVVEVPNQQNLDFFFNNLNRDFSAKTFAYKVPRYGEIWWCGPLFGATEPNWAVIYNIRENCWYDTPLPDGGRTAGYFAQGFRYPVMGGIERGAKGYPLWLHENGLNKVATGTAPTAVRSYFETPYFPSGPKAKQPINEGLTIEMLEPDLEISGDMIITPTGTWNARTDDFDSPAVTLPGNPATPQEAFASFREQRRLLSVRVESNTLNGNYTAGKNILHGRKGDARMFK